MVGGYSASVGDRYTHEGLSSSWLDVWTRDSSWWSLDGDTSSTTLNLEEMPLIHAGALRCPSLTPAAALCTYTSLTWPWPWPWPWHVQLQHSSLLFVTPSRQTKLGPTVWVKKIPLPAACGFLTFFDKRLRMLNQFFYALIIRSYLRSTTNFYSVISNFNEVMLY